jgi:hemolysin III
MKIRREEWVSFGTHMLGVMAAIAGMIQLIHISKGSFELRVVSLIYILSAIFLFLASSLYHAYKQKENEVNIRRKIDHLAIFFMIAGTYTPICYIYLSGSMLWGILLTQWLLVLLGFFFRFFYLNAPRMLYTSIYVLMGWLVIIPIKKLITVMPSDIMVYLLLGGIFYTAGAMIYMIKRPKQLKGLFGFHEIFHLFILMGAVSHYIVVYKGLKNAVGI